MDDAAILPARRKLDVNAYYALAEAGILGEDDRVELVDGDIIEMVPIGQGHSGTVNRLNEVLVLACQGRAVVSVQNPIRLDQRNEPQPDFAILRLRDDFYAVGERAGPADVLAIIEVSDSSLRYDRTVKLELYARSGIPEYWIVDLGRRTLTVHRRPTPAGFDDISTLGPGERVNLALVPGIVVKIDKVFGR